LGGLKAQILLLSQEGAAELTRHLPDDTSLLVTSLIMELEHAQEPLQEGQRADRPQVKVECADDALLEVEQLLAGHIDIPLLFNELDHPVKGGLDGLL
jgi:hypothetical protein